MINLCSLLLFFGNNFFFFEKLQPIQYVQLVILIIYRQLTMYIHMKRKSYI